METPSDITVTINGWDRYWVADALRNESRNIREQYQKRRAKTSAGQNAHARADRLWSLASKIDF